MTEYDVLVGIFGLGLMLVPVTVIGLVYLLSGIIAQIYTWIKENEKKS